MESNEQKNLQGAYKVNKMNVKNSKMDEQPIPFFWIRDASGHRSVSVTLLVVSFFVTTLAFVLSIFNKIGPVEIRPFDVAACSTYMVPILTLYFSRRWTDAKHGITQLREASQFANQPLTNPTSNEMQQTFVPPNGQ
jgi:hypothetical protein